eukprot:scaffold616235_cov102-Attheya_sp.AAC.2
MHDHMNRRIAYPLVRSHVKLGQRRVILQHWQIIHSPETANHHRSAPPPKSVLTTDMKGLGEQKYSNYALEFPLGMLYMNLSTNY